MSADAGRKLAALDFSGTLSIEAARFGRPDVLATALAESGLQDLGVDTPEIFWERLVNPTWDTASTSPGGYARALADALTALRRAHGRPVHPEAIDRCAEAFAARYFAASTVVPEWGRWLRRLTEHDVITVVATDHYAEATRHIAAELSRLDLPAVPLLEAAGQPDGPILVANSADLGCPKSSRVFWETVRNVVGPNIAAVLVIDDFGANEQAQDRYAERTAVRRRRSATVALLGSVFGATVEVEPLIVAGVAAGPGDGRRDAFAHAVDAAGRRAAAWARACRPPTPDQPRHASPRPTRSSAI